MASVSLPVQGFFSPAIAVVSCCIGYASATRDLYIERIVCACTHTYVYAHRFMHTRFYIYFIYISTHTLYMENGTVYQMVLLNVLLFCPFMMINLKS